jgi:hypothetical protein
MNKQQNCIATCSFVVAPVLLKHFFLNGKILEKIDQTKRMRPTGTYLNHPFRSYSSFKMIQENLDFTNLKGPKILFFVAGVLLLLGLFTIRLTTEGLEINFFIAGILLWNGPLYQGFSVCLKMKCKNHSNLVFLCFENLFLNCCKF